MQTFVNRSDRGDRIGVSAGGMWLFGQRHTFNANHGTSDCASSDGSSSQRTNADPAAHGNTNDFSSSSSVAGSS